MKTEQEQIKAIKQIIDERVETTLGYVQGRHGNVIKTVDTVIIARDIVDAGYGDVSEYKAEIKMLGSQIKQAQDSILSLAQQNQEYREQQVKQAQIDVLNKVKEQLFFGVSLSFLRFYVDELIEEVENGEDKG